MRMSLCLYVSVWCTFGICAKEEGGNKKKEEVRKWTPNKKMLIRELKLDGSRLLMRPLLDCLYVGSFGLLAACL